MKHNRIIYSWENLERDIIKIHKWMPFICHYVYGIPRGGLIPALFLAKRFDCGLLTSIPSSIPANTLIVDDIIKTGRTFSSLKRFGLINNKEYIPNKVVLFMRKDCKFSPDFVCNVCEKNDTIIFPWEGKK